MNRRASSRSVRRTPVSTAVLIACGVLVPCAAAQVSFQPVALSGQPAPGTGGATMHGFDIFEYDIGPGSQLTFIAQLSAPGTDGPPQALYAGRPGALNLVAQTGGRAPGTEDGIFFVGARHPNDRSFDQLSLGPGGRVAFEA